MRIQHNIMAMNAYRNYNINTSALSKNLEKLSSGYKINRAGDDAAGLAISEKMRAQITGLNAATKNVKDGISLVKTAEGAMQEIQDMLNRMDYLATQSANGTYQDEVDREALQDEVNALRTEINRIAESANFNGIKLLDGSLDAGTYTGKIQGQVIEGQPQILQQSSTDAFNDVGTKTILKTDTVPKAKTEITVNLHDVAIKNAQEGDKIKLSVGGANLELEVKATPTAGSKKEISAADAGSATVLAQKFADLFAETTANGGADGKLSNQAFGTTVSGSQITFTQTTEPANAGEVVDCAVPATVTFTAGPGVTGGAGGGGGGTPTPAVKAKYSFDLSGATAQSDIDTKTIDGQAISWNSDVDTSMADFVTAYNNATGKDYTATYDTSTKKLTLEAKVAGAVGGATTGAPANAPTTDISLATPAKKATYSFEITAGGTYSDGDTITFGSTTINVNDTGGDITCANAADSAQVAALVASKLQAAGNSEYDISSDGNKVVFTAKTAGALNSAGAPTAAATLTGSATSTSGTLNVGTATTEQAGADAGTPTTVTATQDVAGADEVAGGGGGGGGGTTTPPGTAIGSWNVATTKNKQGAAESVGQLASTKFTLDSSFVTDGGKLTIGKNTYVFAVGKDSKVTATGNEKLIQLKDVDPADTAAVIKAAGIALSNEDGQVFSIGYDHATKKISVHEVAGQTVYGTDELGSVAEFQKLISAQSPTRTVTDDRSSSGKPLTLQIGDTSDDFNQMEVNVGDMHTDKMGTVGGKQISEISVAHQDEAAEAVQVIKDAINYVSSVRGKLGATQNRLEHTQNNLSVMAENIQDAESTIRDTDVAEEMMSYVKNNILVQSAQAMLAQANQVPQGVLQLLG